MFWFEKNRETDEKLEAFLKENPGLEIDRDGKGNVKNVIFPKDTQASQFSACNDKVCFITFIKNGENDAHTFPASSEKEYMAIIEAAEKKYNMVKH